MNHKLPLFCTLSKRFTNQRTSCTENTFRRSMIEKRFSFWYASLWQGKTPMRMTIKLLVPPDKKVQTQSTRRVVQLRAKQTVRFPGCSADVASACSACSSDGFSFAHPADTSRKWYWSPWLHVLTDFLFIIFTAFYNRYACRRQVQRRVVRWCFLIVFCTPAPWRCSKELAPEFVFDWW